MWFWSNILIWVLRSFNGFTNMADSHLLEISLLRTMGRISMPRSEEETERPYYMRLLEGRTDKAGLRRSLLKVAV